MSIFQEPNKLHKVSYGLVWAQALLGGILLGACWSPFAYALFLSLTVIGLLCVHIGKRRATRVITRAIVSVFWVFALILTIIFTEGLTYGLPQTYVESLVYIIVCVLGLYLCSLAPVATAAMLFHGENTAVYDRLMGCLVMPTQLGMVYLAVFAAVDVPWTVNGNILPYLWLLLTIVATVLVWASARLRTAAQEAAIERRRQKHAQAIAARKQK